MQKETYIGNYMPFKREDLDPDGNNDSEKNPNKDIKFRLTARNLFLTYITATQDYLSKESIIDQLKLILLDKIKEYIVSQECYKDGNFYSYVYLKLSYKINILNPKKLDLKDSVGNIIHGQYKTVKKSEDIKTFVKKSGNYITNTDTFNSDVFFSNLYKIAKQDGLDCAMNYFCQQKPEWVSTRYKNIRSNLKCYLLDNNYNQKIK